MNEMWNQFFSLRHDKPRTLQLQIRQQLIDAITNGLIGPNEPLPSSRNLASALKVARNTVIAAYKELEFDGYITPQERRGYFVNEQFYESYTSTDGEQSNNIESPIWHDKLITKKPSAQNNIHNPENWQNLPYSFTIGQIDKSLIPYYEWREVVRHSSTLPEIQKWNADHVDNDDPSLIKQIQSKVLPKRGIWANKDQILITSGSQNAIYMIASLLTKQGTVVGMENPGYPDVRNIFSSKTDNIVPISIDKEGIVIKEISPKTDIIFTTPSHQYPTGVTMSMDRRLELLSVAQDNQMVIIEDDYEAEINFQKKPHPSLKSLDKKNNVIYVGSFSKAFAPGLRRLMIRHIPANNQRSVALFIGLGHYHNMFTKIQKTNKERWRLINEKINQEPLLSCTPTLGGSTFWVELPKTIDSDILSKNLLTKGVSVRSGNTLFNEKNPPSNFLHLGYSAIDTNKINKGMDIIIAEIKSLMHKSR
ncbi:PLP-dependent aminotransferase family protein [Candidatus Thioglobus sp.]|nr:PLP-dependent aminotransferase family protein [Candidatus Thioglobus sp.]